MGRRPKRVGEMVLRELGELFQQGAIKDPNIGFLTFTAVDMSPDLRLARVYYAVHDDADGQVATQAALDRASPYVRRQLGQRLRLKRTPALEFHYDASLDNAARIEELLRDVQPADEVGDSAEDDGDEDDGR